MRILIGRHTVFLLGVLLLSGCGGGSGGSDNGAGTTTPSVTTPPTDTTAPEGYSVAFDIDSIDLSNQTSVSFTVFSAEIATSYEYEISADASSSLNGEGTVSSETFSIENLDLSSLPDGTITLALTLTDSSANEGASAEDSIEKNTVVAEPTGFDISANFIKGPVTGAICEIYEVSASGDKGDLLAVSMASLEGVVNFASLLDYTGFALLECSGGTYLDEVTNEVLSAPLTRAIVSVDGDSAFTVSPMTEIAVRLAEAEGNLNTAASSFNNQVAEAFGIDGDITTVVPAEIDDGENADPEQSEYLAALLIISQLDSQDSGDVSDIVDDLATDFEASGFSDSNAALVQEAIQELIDSEEFLLSIENKLEELSDLLPPPPDITAPSGYSVVFDVQEINLDNQSSISFSVSSAEVGADFEYEFSLGTTSLNGEGIVSSENFSVENIDLSSFPDGSITLTLVLTDVSGNRGQNVSDSVEKLTADTEAPFGYSVSIEQSQIDTTNQTDLSFTVFNAEIGTSYSYVLESGGILINGLSGSGTVTESDFVISEIDVSGLPDGTISLSFYLEDDTGNRGETVTDIVNKNTSPSQVTISGKLTFDLVPHFSSSSGLDYDSTIAAPIRGVVVEALDSGGNVLATDISDDSGNYSLVVDPFTDVRIQVKAQMLRAGSPDWDVQVTDNTNGNALYAMAGSLADSGSEDSVRNLHASSGWGDSSYTGTRTAGPFAILNPIYDVLIQFSAVDPDISFPEIEFRWSVDNSTSSGSLTSGDIGTSFYNGQAIYILGKEDQDSDEYDDHIVVHEWGHYFEGQLSRSDSIGGSHSLADKLDIRIAFGEGFGNALSGITTGDSIYRDSFGNEQGNSFFFDVEQSPGFSVGWYSEASIQAILYDLFDSDDDNADTVSLGLGPLYETLVDPDYTGVLWPTSIYSFIEQLKANLNDSTIVNIDIPNLLQAENIFGEGNNGLGETNTGDISNSLPVFTQMNAAGSPYTICSINDLGTYNKLGNRVFGEIEFMTSGSHTLTMTRISGATNRDPDFILTRAGNRIHLADSGDTDVETYISNFNAETLILEAYDWRNVANQSPGDSCYEFSIVEN